MKKQENQRRLLIIAGVLIIMIVIVRMSGISQFIRLENATLLRDWVAGFGVAGPVVYILIYIAACLLMLPGFAVTLMGALAFGPIWGTVYTSIGSTLGAAAAFLTARYAARKMVENWLDENETFQRIDRGVEKQGWRMLMVTRMVPLFPFNLQNFAYGLTRISLGTYVVVSWVCMIPGIAAYNFMAGSVVAGEGDPGRVLFYLGIGAVFFVFVSLIPGQIRKRQEGLADD
ncbi:TVP38/TMEM64 family protein [Anoxynatronum sibiricum]|uniref:TVP38/TMEM64 family membrane protein n=1 Tax=Anoxynatronum sibiricum TaxID=210623 RepID=A0ABU9VVL0_9CLOT